MDDVVVPMDALGDTYFRLANDDRVGRAVRASAQSVLSLLQIGYLWMQLAMWTKQMPLALS